MEPFWQYELLALLSSFPPTVLQDRVENYVAAFHKQLQVVEM